MDHPISPELWLRTILRNNRLLVSDEALQLLGRLVDAIVQANKSVNLISRKDEHNIWERHVLHCLSILFLFRFPDACRVLDLGSGGGLPGLPLKIMVPSLALTMVDATKKKVSAVERIVADLKLEGVRTLWARAEDLGSDEAFKEQFDVVVARAVGPLEDLVQLAHPFLKKGETSMRRDHPRREPEMLGEACLLAYKGGDIERELEKARRIRYVRSVQVRPLVFEGSAEIELEDKKIVIVHFT